MRMLIATIADAAGPGLSSAMVETGACSAAHGFPVVARVLESQD
jgi:hypothetical protein